MKIALVGTAANTWQEALSLDSDWQLWGLHGHWNVHERFHRLYELHSLCVNARWTKESGISEKWEAAWRRVGSRAVVHPTLCEKYPDAAAFDFEGKLARYGRVFTSTLAWMMADALDTEGVEEIGLFGTTLTTQDEYEHQRPMMCLLAGVAMARGIKLTTAQGCGLLKIPYLYGYEDEPTVLVDLRQRRSVVQQRLDEAREAEAQARENARYQEGALDVLGYMGRTWGV